MLKIDIEKCINNVILLNGMQNDAENQRLRARIEQKFQEEVKLSNSLLTFLCEVETITDFRISLVGLDKCKELLSSMEEGYTRGESTQEINQLLAENRKKIVDLIKNDWSVFYSRKSTALLHLLKLITDITEDKEYTQQVINKIESAKLWTTIKRNYELFSAGLVEGERIVQNMELDSEIIEFLQKVTMQQASLLDINQKIATWIKKERLEEKFRISL